MKNRIVSGLTMKFSRPKGDLRIGRNPSNQTSARMARSCLLGLNLPHLVHVDVLEIDLSYGDLEAPLQGEGRDIGRALLGREHAYPRPGSDDLAERLEL